MRAEISAEWIDYFRSNGFPHARGLDTGMEGAVYTLVPDQLVAKVWVRKTEPELAQLKAFYDALTTEAGQVATPEIKEVRVVNGVPVSIERFLPGSLLQGLMPDDALRANKHAVDAVIQTLSFLRSVRPQPELSRLSVLGEDAPWDIAATWSGAIGSVLDRRLTRYGDQLRNQVPDVGAIREAASRFLASRDDVPLSLIHGDLCGANIMIDASSKPLSVIDFGFLSTIGDPAFDASISSGIFNMYGPAARAIDDQVTAAVSVALDYPRTVLLAYRAVYALLTSNVYSPEGTDGHFQWCVNTLRRDDVRASLPL